MRHRPVLGPALLAAATLVALLTVGVAAALAVIIVGSAFLVPSTMRRRLAGAEEAEFEQRDGGPAAGRRRFLRMLAMGAAPAIAMPSLLNKMSSVGTTVRAMDHSALTPEGRVRQWTMIIDLRRCDGCRGVEEPPRCTLACIEGHYVPEPMEWIQVFEDELPGGGSAFIPMPCLQCQNAPCVNVCPVAATFHDPSGTVLIDQERCIGCRICMAACPYDRRFFNWGDPPVPPEALLADYSPEHQTPASKGTVMKCDFCPDAMRAGTLPYCVQACPNDAIYYGDLEEDIATNSRHLVSATTLLSEGNAMRVKEHLGTEPRVYHLPGHGELVGRNVHDTGRLATRWPWVERVKGAVTWRR